MTYYYEQWEAIWNNPKTGIEEAFQFTKYPFQNPHRKAKEEWSKLRCKQFKVKFIKRINIENKFSIQNYLKTKEDHKQKYRNIS